MTPKCPVDTVSAAPASPTNDNRAGNPAQRIRLFALAGFPLGTAPPRQRVSFPSGIEHHAASNLTNAALTMKDGIAT